jgi:hypothetical protein
MYPSGKSPEGGWLQGDWKQVYGELTEPMLNDMTDENLLTIATGAKPVTRTVSSKMHVRSTLISTCVGRRAGFITVPNILYSTESKTFNTGTLELMRAVPPGAVNLRPNAKYFVDDSGDGEFSGDIDIRQQFKAKFHSTIPILAYVKPWGNERTWGEIDEATRSTLIAQGYTEDNWGQGGILIGTSDIMPPDMLIPPPRSEDLQPGNTVTMNDGLKYNVGGTEYRFVEGAEYRIRTEGVDTVHVTIYDETDRHEYMEVDAQGAPTKYRDWDRIDKATHGWLQEQGYSNANWPHGIEISKNCIRPRLSPGAAVSPDQNGYFWQLIYLGINGSTPEQNDAWSNSLPLDTLDMDLESGMVELDIYGSHCSNPNQVWTGAGAGVSLITPFMEECPEWYAMHMDDGVTGAIEELEYWTENKSKKHLEHQKKLQDVATIHQKATDDVNDSDRIRRDLAHKNYQGEELDRWIQIIDRTTRGAIRGLDKTMREVIAIVNSEQGEEMDTAENQVHTAQAQVNTTRVVRDLRLSQGTDTSTQMEPSAKRRSGAASGGTYHTHKKTRRKKSRRKRTKRTTHRKKTRRLT